jgi:2-amino-4-hydroxy-6-hydroxymethyldihydropteridine diphosphokinase
MNKPVVLVTGSNLGDRMANLLIAEEFLEKEGIRFIKKSSVYETEAWGKEDQPDFYNRVLVCETALHPEELILKLKQIEQSIGRTSEEKWDPRVIDIDLLFYEDRILKTERLSIPHPMIAERRFTLIPLSEVLPLFIHPVLRKSIAQLLSECSDSRKVWNVNPEPAIYSGQSESSNFNS